MKQYFLLMIMVLFFVSCEEEDFEKYPPLLYVNEMYENIDNHHKNDTINFEIFVKGNSIPLKKLSITETPAGKVGSGVDFSTTNANSIVLKEDLLFEKNILSAKIYYQYIISEYCELDTVTIVFSVTDSENRVSECSKKIGIYY